MNRPLYKGHETSRPNGEFHRGLWFDRFFGQYAPDWTVPKPDKKTGTEPKRDWISQVTGPCGSSSMLQHHNTGLVALVRSLPGGDTRTFVTDWHFATGLGNPHPVENGFLWHPTLGTPYIPGAAVKGLVRAWVEYWHDALDNDARLLRLHRWFGSDDKDQAMTNQPTQTGSLIFFDALPTEPVQLALDVMTPHMGNWYAQGGDIENVDSEPEAVPADWHNPVPVPFLVASKASFLFAIAARGKEFAGDVAEVMKTLEAALGFLGAGAKTAVGYGYMKPRVDTAGDAWIDEKIKEICSQHNSKPEEALRATHLAEAWKAIEDNALKRKVRAAIESRWRERNIWENPSGKAAKRAKSIYTEL